MINYIYILFTLHMNKFKLYCMFQYRYKIKTLTKALKYLTDMSLVGRLDQQVLVS